MIIFETTRLRIRHFRESDFPGIFRLQSDPDTMRYIRAPVNEEHIVQERMEMWETYSRQNPGLGVFALEIKAGEVFAGYVTARHTNFKPETEEYEVGYVLAPEWWGQGLVSEVVPPLCAYLFQQSGTQKIVAFTDPENIASQRVLLKCGFREVGIRQVYEGPSKEFWLEKT